MEAGPASERTRFFRSLTREEVRAVDRLAIEHFGIPGVVLMENAGIAAAEHALEMARGRAGFVAILCGAGNNGGDGYVVARQLVLRGRAVRRFDLHPAGELSGDAALQRAIVDRMGIPASTLDDPGGLAAELEGAALVVDGLLGTGFRGAVRPHLAAVIDALNAFRARTGVRVLALDLPSGLDADTGVPGGTCVRADRTVTFVAPKVGFERPGAREYTGEVCVASIGAPLGLDERAQ